MSVKTVRRYLAGGGCPDWKPGRQRPTRVDAYTSQVDLPGQIPRAAPIARLALAGYNQLTRMPHERERFFDKGLTNNRFDKKETRYDDAKPIIVRGYALRRADRVADCAALEMPTSYQSSL
jgi:hypothetical protein